MTDELTPARLEANMREISLIMSRLAAALTPHMEEFARAMYEARPVIGDLIFRDRKCRGWTRERYAGAHNVPVDWLIRVERWRLLLEPAKRADNRNEGGTT